MRSDSSSVSMVIWTHNDDLNSALGEISKESSSSTIPAEVSFNDDGNKETLNVNKVC